MPVTKWGDRYPTVTASASASIDTSDFLRKSGDILEGDLDIDKHRVINLPEPIDNDDAVTLRYADANYLKCREGIITNELVMQSKTTFENGLDVESTLNMNNHPITNVPSPEQNSDAANKAYVDVVRAELASKLDIAGGTVNGLVTMENILTLENILNMQAVIDMNRRKIINLATPTHNTDAATKAYVDTKLPADGGVMEGELDMDGNKIINVAAPVDSSDAATKAYVDEVQARLDELRELTGMLAARVALIEGALNLGRSPSAAGIS